MKTAYRNREGQRNREEQRFGAGMYEKSRKMGQKRKRREEQIGYCIEE